MDISCNEAAAFKDIEILNEDGTRSKYVIYKYPPIAGRRIALGYPLTAFPRKYEDYAHNEKVMMELMSFVGVRVNDTIIRLSTESLLNNHVKGWFSLVSLEWESLKYNCSFLEDGAVVESMHDMVKRLALAYFADVIQDTVVQVLMNEPIVEE
jgi:hypothetical protein